MLVPHKVTSEAMAWGAPSIPAPPNVSTDAATAADNLSLGLMSSFTFLSSNPGGRERVPAWRCRDEPQAQTRCCTGSAREAGRTAGDPTTDMAATSAVGWADVDLRGRSSVGGACSPEESQLTGPGRVGHGLMGATDA
ncbi:hypothetical protein BN12_30023 [Nostocoides japonicum T1-X7]|uniref:Uncharacterized protein n=1 Tax=Nostocoides japonicum T1-X7 TaxID=1194083 RepID=A0A077M040_9MICO|nr:hypothetical protein BN12_30023 [Tetrasphaera japonica T1-X7]